MDLFLLILPFDSSVLEKYYKKDINSNSTILDTFKSFKKQAYTYRVRHLSSLLDIKNKYVLEIGSITDQEDSNRWPTTCYADH